MKIVPLKVGLIGCGQISVVYLKNCATMPEIDVIACADLAVERARHRANDYGIARVETVEELLRDEEVEAILNLTVPAAHGELNLMAIEQGKHLYSEKPLAISRADGQQIVAAAAAKGLLVGCAPDTFFGGSWQTVRRLIDAGAIGEPVAGSASMLGHGMEHWHPDPGFFYQPGAGPLFDMGPYYLTMLITLLGPVRRVTGTARITFPQRAITSKPRSGQMLAVTTPSHVAALLEFLGGPVVNLTTSFDVWSHHLPHIEIYGSEGTMMAPDPNYFEGPACVKRGRGGEWEDVEVEYSHDFNARGVGLQDMAIAIRTGRPNRAGGTMAYHVLDVMHAILESAETGRHVELASTCGRPEPLA